MAALGRSPESEALFLENELLTADERASCTSALDAGKLVPYGLLSDAHHAACWRIGHLHRLHEHIAPMIAGDYHR